MKYKFENYTLDTERRELRCNGIIQSVEPQVLDLLHFLIKNCDRVVSRENIFQAVWRGRIVSDEVLSTRINAARKAIGDDGTQQRLIKTLRRNGFRFIGVVREAKAETNAPLIMPLGKLSVAVVSSTAYDGDEELAGIAKGITDDLTVALARSRTFDVIAHNHICSDGDDPRPIARELGASYLIICGLRRASDRVRLTVRLIDGSVGLHIWARSYTQGLATGFVDQDAVTAQIAAATEPCIYAAEAKRQREKPFHALDAIDCVTKALVLGKHRTPENVAIAEELLRRAIELEPHYGRAHSVLAELLGREVLYGRKPRRSNVPLAVEAAQKAVLCDEHDAWAHFALGWAFSMSRSPEAGIEEYRKALAINPYLPHIQYSLAAALSSVGETEKALAELGEAEYLGAPEVYPGQCNSIRASICFLSEKHDEAIKAARRSVWQSPSHIFSYHQLAVNYALVGKVEEARAELATLVRLAPNTSLNVIAESLPYIHDRETNQTLDAFRLMGIR
jgi:DNA-binding winged helix-turn-helix (wHTH) protein/tetratricopeptide (TPR) repeat protein